MSSTDPQSRMPVALYMLALAIFVMGTSEFMLAGLLPTIAADLDVSVGAAGILTSAFAVGLVIGAPLMAAFARGLPPRTVLLTCVLVFAAGHTIAAITPSFAVLLVTRVVSALAYAGFLAVALSTATALVPRDRKGRALAIMLSGSTMAKVAGVPAGALLGTAAGWRAAFWVIAVLCLPAAVGIRRGIQNRREALDAPPRLRAELGQLRSPRLVLVITLGALVNGGTFAALTFVAPVVTDTAGLNEAWIPIVLVMFGVGSFLGVTLAGRLSDRKPHLVLAVGGPLLLAGWVALALIASNPVLLVPLAFTQGVLSFGVGSTLIALVLYAAADAPTMGGSYATAALNIGAAAGPALGAVGLATGAGALAPVWVAAALTALALLVLLASTRHLTAAD